MITRSGELASSFFNTQNVSGAKTPSDRASSASKASEAKELSKVERLKEQIANGEYKINLEATAKKMAQELL